MGSSKLDTCGRSEDLSGLRTSMLLSCREDLAPHALLLLRMCLSLKRELNEVVHGLWKQAFDKRHQGISHLRAHEAAFVIGAVFLPALSFLFKEAFEHGLADSKKRSKLDSVLCQNA